MSDGVCGDIMEAANKLVNENAKGAYILGSRSGKSIEFGSNSFDYLTCLENILESIRIVEARGFKMKFKPKKIYDEFG